MVDMYNDKPVYRQEAGDHYLYYHEIEQCWMVGSRVGQKWAWFKHPTSEGADLPSDLDAGWVYQPLSRVRGESNRWESDDTTLRVETLGGDFKKFKDHFAAIFASTGRLWDAASSAT